MRLAWIGGLLLLPLVARGDVLQLANGQTIKGRVLAYWKGTFELADETGQIFKCPVASVKHLELAGGTVVLQTRTKGRLEGSLTAYENGQFVVQMPNGKTEQVPATFVDEIAFNSGGSGGNASGSGGSTGGNRAAPDATSPRVLRGSGSDSGSSGGGSDRKIETLTHGNSIDLAKSLPHGKVTIVDFYADWCGPCRAMGPSLERIARENADVVLRKIDIVKWSSPVAEQFAIRSIPHVDVYDRQANLVGTVLGVRPNDVQALVDRAKDSGR